MAKSKFGKFMVIVLVVLLSGIVTAGVAVANNLQTDTDLDVDGNQKVVDLGNVAPGFVFTDTVRVYIQRTGQGPTTYDPPVEIDFSPGTTGINGNGGTISSTGVGNGFDASIQGSAPLTEGEFSFTVRWRVATTGTGINDSPASMVYKGNVELTSTPADTTPPTSTHSITSGTVGDNDWYRSTVEVEITATDNAGGSGVKEIHYTLNGGTTIVTAGPSVFLNITTEGTNTLVYWAVDNADNTETPANSVEIKIDKTAPSTPSIALTTEAWTNQDVRVTITAGEDTVSGVAKTEYRTKLGTADWSDWTVYTAVFDITAEGETIVEARTIDNAGNESTVAEKTAKIDKTNPVVTFDGSAPTVYTLNSTATVSWNAADPLPADANSNSGLATPESGSEVLDTSSAGTKYVEVTATDNAGNSQTYTFNYTVQYNFSGILQPINSDGTSVFKQGSTIPVKFQLRDANGEFVTNATATIALTKIYNGTPGDVNELITTGNANTGNLFRYDSKSNQYIFNLGTRNLTVGTYEVTINPGDGTQRKIRFGLR